MFREKLASAIDRKNNDINSFIWKGRKQEVNGALVQEEKRFQSLILRDVWGWKKVQTHQKICSLSQILMIFYLDFM